MDFMDRRICGASSWATADRSPVATVSAGAVVSAPAAAYCCCCQANRNDCAVGSAESSVPKPVARPMTRTPTTTIAAATMRERFARLAAGVALRPGLPELGATWRAGRGGGERGGGGGGGAGGGPLGGGRIGGRVGSVVAWPRREEAPRPGVAAALARRRGHDPPACHRRRFKARSTSLAASRLARSWRLS